ncbi:MAG TPA: transposase [Anaerolineales bacterium]|nr:transposase [Anaerolineales bacterium]
MSGQSEIVPVIPKDTFRAAKAIFGGNNFYMLVGERLEVILHGLPLRFATLRDGVPALHGILLALTTLFQFVEGLTDIQAIDAVRTRIEWKFALHLSLLPTILHEQELCEFRQRILADPSNQSELQRLIDGITAFIPVRAQNFQDLKSLEAVSFVCLVNCLDHAQQAMNDALAVLAAQFPDWLRRVALPHWYSRYNSATPRLEVALLLGQQRFFMEETRADIHHLLEEIKRSGTREMSELHEVKMLDQIWSRQLLNQCQFEEVGNDLRLQVTNCPSCMLDNPLSTCCCKV